MGFVQTPGCRPGGGGPASLIATTVGLENAMRRLRGSWSQYDDNGRETMTATRPSTAEGTGL